MQWGRPIFDNRWSTSHVVFTCCTLKSRHPSVHFRVAACWTQRLQDGGRSLTCVCFHVLIKILLHVEVLAAPLAHELLVSDVYAHVGAQLVLVLEPLVTVLKLGRGIQNTEVRTQRANVHRCQQQQKTSSSFN